MARIEAYYAVDMTDFNLNRINVGLLDSEFLPDMDFDFLGQIHPEVLALQWQIGSQTRASAFLGDNFVVTEVGLAGGTVTGFVEFLDTSSGLTPIWGLSGVQEPALDLYQAGLTASTQDDAAIFEAALASSDTFEMSEWNDVALGYAGHDTLMGFDGNDSLFGNSGHDLLDGGTGDDDLSGGMGRDTLIGGAGHDSLRGGEDENDLRDVIYAGDGDDYADGGYGNDELRGDLGNDTLVGNFGADTLIGGQGDDFLNGAALADVLFGGAGEDFLNGGFGFDRLNGGDGADRFFHIGMRGHGSDWIQDFSGDEGDSLVLGRAANADEFRLTFAETPGAGDADVAEAFVIYRTTGQVLWALVDGAAQGEIVLGTETGTFDLMA